MRRRNFIKAIAGSAAAWPLGTRAQQPIMPLIGFLRSTSPSDSLPLVIAFRDGLKESGFVEGQNVAIEFRYAEDRNERLPALAAELIHNPVAVIVGNSLAAIAAVAATTKVPIVFVTGTDPVRDHLVASLNKPGGNVTGIVFFSSTLASKRLEFLRQLVPKATTIALLVRPNTPETEAERRDMMAAAKVSGQQLMTFDATSEREIESAFATAANRGAGA